MSDNVVLNPGEDGDIAAADDIGGVKYQRVKLTIGSDGVNDGDVSDANPMPVDVKNFPAQTALTDSQLRDSPVPVFVSNMVGAGLTDSELRATPVPVEAPGAAQDATLQALATLNDTMLVLLSAILEKMPRVTGNDQVAASIETIPAISIAANQDLRNITGALANVTSIGGKPASTTADALAMAGTGHIYNNITVSA